MHREAGEIFAQLIETSAAPAVRDRAWFYLAKIRYQRGLLAEAEQAIDRIQNALFLEAVRCVEEGLASPQEVDEVVRSCFGFRLPFFGPFQISDMAGLDVYENVLDVLREGLGERFTLRFRIKNHLTQCGFAEVARRLCQRCDLSKNGT